MGQLAEAIATINSRELDQNEAAIAACFPSTAHELSNEMKATLVPFVRWCEAQKVRALPARPTTVAAFVQWQQDKGVQPFDTLCAIEGLHLFAGMANPVATPVVRSVTESTPVEPPRSWTKTEKDEFKLFPRHAQEVIARREQSRETALRRAQNDLAERRKTGGSAKPTDTTTKEIEMAKKEEHQKGAGPYSNSSGEDPIVRREGHLPAQDKGRDISRSVDSAGKVDDGFSGALPSKE